MLDTIKEIYKYKGFLLELVKRDFKKKYYKSVLGVVWTVLNPLLMMLVITFIFSMLFQRNIQYFPVYYLAGWSVFNFNAEATNTSMHSILGNSGLIKKIYIPAYIFPISCAIIALSNKLISLLPMFLVMAILHAPFHLTLLAIPLLLIPLFFFSLGLGLALSAMGVYFRDLTYLYGIIMQLWMYLSCIFYPIDIIPEHLRFLWNFNPLYPFIASMRGLVLDGVLPDSRNILFMIFYAILAMGIGANVYRKLEKDFVLHF